MSFRFIAGADDFLVLRQGEAEWAIMTQSAADPHSCEVIDGQAGNVDEVGKAIGNFISSIQTVSLFGDEKAVWFKNITFLADSVTGRAEGTVKELDLLQNALSNVDSAGVKILITASPVDRRKKGFKWFQKNSDFHFIEAGKDDSSLVTLIQQEAQKDGKVFKPGAAELLVGKINANTRLALEEVQKLVTYLGNENEIEQDHITELVPQFGEGDFFESVEAFYSLRLPWTLSAIHRHFFAGYDARPMITSLQNRNRLLIQLKALEHGGYFRGRPSKNSLEKAATELGIYFEGSNQTKSSFNVFTQNPWYLGRLSEVLPKLNLKKLVQFQQAFSSAFLEIISRPNDQESVMRECAIQCLSQIK